MYHVTYDAPDGLRLYCVQPMSLAVATEHLAKFKARYLNPDGTGRAYPNGEGFYPFRNPVIVRVG